MIRLVSQDDFWANKGISQGVRMEQFQKIQTSEPPSPPQTHTHSNNNSSIIPIPPDFVMRN